MPLNFRPQNNKRSQDWQGNTRTGTKYILDFYACHVMMLPIFEPAVHHTQKSNKSNTFFRIFLHWGLTSTLKIPVSLCESLRLYVWSHFDKYWGYNLFWGNTGSFLCCGPFCWTMHVNRPQKCLWRQLGLYYYVFMLEIFWINSESM